MKAFSCMLLVVALSWTAAPWAGGAPAKQAGRTEVERPAMSMRVAAPGFADPELVMLKANPPQFELVLSRDMPTPGWKFELDAVHVDVEAHRISVEATEIAPGGVTAQVITRTKMKIPLGTVERGPYLLELWLRRDKARGYRPAGALVLVGS